MRANLKTQADNTTIEKEIKKYITKILWRTMRHKSEGIRTDAT